MPQIKEAFFEDHNADIFTFYTSKNSVLGLKYPDSSISNKNYKYIRIAYLTFNPTDSTEVFCVDEKLNVQLEYIDPEKYLSNKVFSIGILGMVRGNNIVPGTFKCSLQSAFEDIEVPEVYLSQQTKITSGEEHTILSVWVKTEDCDRVFINSESSHSENNLPINIASFDCRYLLTIIDNDSLVVDDDTSGMDSFIDSIKFCTGVERLQNMSYRITRLEENPLLNIKSAHIYYDAGFEPIPTGSDSESYQVVTPASITYGESDAPFMYCDATNRYIKVNESGTYQLQLTSGLFVEGNNSTTGKIEVCMYLNSDRIINSVLKYDPKLGINQLSSGIHIVNITQGDLLRVRFKFLGEKGNDIRNNGYTAINVTKLI